MITLDATTKSLEVKLAGAVATTELPYASAWVDLSQTTFELTGSSAADGTTNGGTAVAAVAAPSASSSRKLNYLSIVNVDTAAVTLTVQVNNSGTKRIVFKAALAVGDQVSFTDAGGWAIFDANGNKKDIIAPAAAGTLTGTTLASNVVTSSLTAVGTITTGVWNAGALTTSGVLTVNGFGAHNFNASGTGLNLLQLFNSAAGTTNEGVFGSGSDAVTSRFGSTSSTFTATGIKPQRGTYLFGDGTGGLSIGATDASGVMRLYTGGTTVRVTLGTGGLWQWHAYGAGALSSDASGNITASDGRFKERVRTYAPGLAAIRKLRPVAYHWNKASGWDRRYEYVGFIAQEVRSAIPGSVPGGLQRGKRMNFDDRAVMAATVNAIQELHARIAKIERKAA